MDNHEKYFVVFSHKSFYLNNKNSDKDVALSLIRTYLEVIKLLTTTIDVIIGITPEDVLSFNKNRVTIYENEERIR